MSGPRYFDKFSASKFVRKCRKNSAIGEAEVAAYDFTRLETGAGALISIWDFLTIVYKPQGTSEPHIGETNITRRDLKQFEDLMMSLSVSLTEL